MTRNYKGLLIGLLVCTLSCGSQKKLSTSETSLTENDLIGIWTFQKAVDKSNNEVKYFIQDYLGPDGKEIKVVASGPDWTINGDGTYKLDFTKKNSDVGIWELIETNKIKFTMVINPDSDQGRLISQTQKLLNKKWEKDENGNYLDSSTKEIIQLKGKQMKVDWRKKYTLFYHKK